ncbi:hypothetical protein [Acaryochloris thomasi]|uniref:hypothetical protein n=1 Tax=Acaryochloris thomasi TaxID=2929456 RepID=UPI0011B7F37A|nr:hypothetical protein [Acaryochloris thomasi]
MKSMQQEKGIILGVTELDEQRIFELSIQKEPLDDSIVISTARINRKTKVVSVIISNLEKKNSALP